MKNPFADKMITRLLEQYEIDVEMTFVDLVDRIEELAEDTGDINLSPCRQEIQGRRAV